LRDRGKKGKPAIRRECRGCGKKKGKIIWRWDGYSIEKKVEKVLPSSTVLITYWRKRGRRGKGDEGYFRCTIPVRGAWGIKVMLSHQRKKSLPDLYFHRGALVGQLDRIFGRGLLESSGRFRRLIIREREGRGGKWALMTMVDRYYSRNVAWGKQK